MSEYRRFAVCGKPILHSRSPGLFNACFQAVGLRAGYTRLAADSGAEALELYRRLNLQGMNVTAPFKSELCELMDELATDAAVCGAVNTVISDEGRLYGYNTDQPGVIHALRERGFDPAGKECLVLGAGGAGRAATRGLLQADATVTLVNRTFSRAESVATRLGCRAEPWSALPARLQQAQLLLSTLPAGVDAIKAEWLHTGLTVFEAPYPATPLLREARARGCTVLSGEEWLLAQAVHGARLLLGETVDHHNLAQARAEPKPTVIALLGFMGAGKTSIGRALAQELNCPFCDLDNEIEQRAGAAIPALFRELGEAAFRRLESDALLEAVENGSRIIACGGGILTIPDNRELLAEHCLRIWLAASLESCLARIDLESRPLLAGPAPEITAARLWAAREQVYFENADLIINADNDIQQVAGKLADEIGRTFPYQR